MPKRGEYLFYKKKRIKAYKKGCDYVILDNNEINMNGIQSLKGEVWKTIKQAPEYAISNKGRVLSKERGVKTKLGTIQHIKARIRKLHLNHKGYYKIRLGKKSYFIHRLVAQTFIPNLDNKPQVNHIDGNKQNNYVENLEWCTNSENQIHALKMGLKVVSDYCGKPKKPVCQIDLLSGDILNIYPSLAEAARSVNQKSKSPIRFVCQGKRKQAAGFKWAYIGENL